MTDKYWITTIEESFAEYGIEATPEQIIGVASWVEGNSENYGLYTGEDVIFKGMKSEAEIKVEQLEKKIEEKRIFELKPPCRYCCTTGSVKDSWGRDVRCEPCRGDGRL